MNGWVKAGMVVAVAAVLLTGYLVVKSTADFVKGAVVPQYTMYETVLATIGELKKQEKLVVLLENVTVDVELSSDKTYLWDLLDLGRTTVSMKVPGNKVQYYIPAGKIGPNSVRWDEKENKLVLDLPDPVLDTEIIEVQSDPKFYIIRKDIGWARLDSHSGAYLENTIKSRLRDLVIKTARNDLVMEKAKQNADEVVRDMFAKVLNRNSSAKAE
jgi:hypothetical protein